MKQQTSTSENYSRYFVLLHCNHIARRVLIKGGTLKFALLTPETLSQRSITRYKLTMETLVTQRQQRDKIAGINCNEEQSYNTRDNLNPLLPHDTTRVSGIKSYRCEAKSLKDTRNWCTIQQDSTMNKISLRFQKVQTRFDRIVTRDGSILCPDKRWSTQRMY